jgi:hypothetical protein
MWSKRRGTMVVRERIEAEVDADGEDNPGVTNSWKLRNQSFRSPYTSPHACHLSTTSGDRSMRPTAILLALLLVTASIYGDDKPVKPITPDEAAKKLNEKVTVEMVVKSTGGKTACFLNSETDFKSDKNFTLFISGTTLEKFKKAKIDDPKTFYKGKTVHATGTVTLYQEKPQIKIEEPDQIKVIEKKEAEKK